MCKYIYTKTSLREDRQGGKERQKERGGGGGQYT